jgi:hypothetical protein
MHKPLSEGVPGAGIGTHMNEVRSLARRYFRVVLTVVSIPVLGFGVIAGGVAYLNWSAERRARAFCEEIALGSDVSLAVANAKGRKILQGSNPVGSVTEYSFYFPGTMFDKAVCRAEVDRNEKVVSKGADMEYD